MSDEKNVEETQQPEEQAEQLPVATEGEAWEVVETIDDLVASGQSNEFMKNQFYFEFKQGDRIVRGLTVAAYAHLALVEGISIEEMEIVGLKTGYEANAVAVKFDTGQRAYGTAFQPYMDSYGKLDVFAKQKVISKASRNARKQLLPYQLVVEAISNLAGLPNALPPASTEAQNGKTLKERKQGEMFAVFAEREKELTDMGIDKFTFWAGVKVKNAILSRADMSEVQMITVVEALRAKQLPKWVTDLKYPNYKVRLFAITEQHKDNLPADIWDKIKEKTGVKDLRRLTLAHAKICYDEIRAELGMDVDTDDSPEGNAAENLTEEEKQEGTAGAESNIPF